MNRILHVGVGPLGQRILAELHERRVGHVVAAVDPADGLADTPLSRHVPGADPKIRILPSLGHIEDWSTIDAAIVTTASDVPSCATTFRELLRRGIAVVTTCEEMVYPWLRHVALADELDELARSSGGRILGTGVNPGFLMDALPAYLTCISRSIRSVACARVQDASSRRLPFQKKIGAGLDDAAFAQRVREGTLRHVGLGESLHFLSHYLGLPIDHWEEDIAPVHAEHDLVSALGPIPRGRVAGVRQVAIGTLGGRHVLRLEFLAAIGQKEPHDRIVIEGEPPVDLTIRGGIHGDVATSAIVINSVPRVIAAPPGLHTMATIPPPVHAISHHAHA
jgi:4-hydroxy-tetrahydrodipicolinate reductase